MSFPTLNEQLDLLRAGVDQIIPEEELEQKIASSIKTGQPLRVKLGCDPSRPDLHLGHGVVLRKLRHFQDLGHTAVLVVGDFTGMIGDPSGRNKTRPPLSLKEARENGRSYYDQATLILSETNLEIRYNSEWLQEIDFATVIRLASNITVARMMERDDFTKRFREGTPISLHELLYPLAQAYDSVELRADVELGGTDQTFNLHVGRDLQRAYGQKPQVIITTPLLEGTDGTEKMSKSYDNYISLSDPANDMYGKVMSIPDHLIVPYFRYCTNVAPTEIETISDAMTNSTANPRDFKRRLAREIAFLYHSEADGLAAEENFDRVIVQKDMPTEIPEYQLTEPESFLVAVMKAAGLVKSNGEGRRLISQGAVKIDGTAVTDPNTILKQGTKYTLRAGKRRFLQIN